mmetsp:Transcript_18500/g.60227  ORF Transcript_18500/g.60227 Transcript_18500/m.60227 type:complete len:82 (+) Transcript_18500:206-451(+)
MRTGVRAALLGRTEAVPLSAAVGRTCAELVCPYPPGVPTLVPGAAVTSAAVEHLRAVQSAGGKVVGAADETLRTLEVLVEE